jgi:hypothetical protein
MTKNRPPTSEPGDSQPAKKIVHFSKFDDEKTLARFAALLPQILAQKELIIRDGTVVASWKTYRGKRLGPYFRVAFRDNRRLRAIYIGRDELLAQLAKALIEELKHPLRQDRYLRQVRQLFRAAWRQSVRETERFVAPLGFRRRGLHFCKQREP